MVQFCFLLFCFLLKKEFFTLIIKNKQLNLKHIAESGQCFRMNLLGTEADGTVSYGVIAYGKFLKLTQLDEETVLFHCSEEEFQHIWNDYFDLEYDYNFIVEQLQAGDDSFLKSASEYGCGLRILKQEPFEALISFIISQNKNIPAIKSTIEKLSKAYGEEIVTEDGIYYSFPTPRALADATKEDLRKTGLGYRDEYILRTSKAVAEKEIILEDLVTISHEESVEKLLSLHGVGIKVATCMSLYGLHHIEAFPIDTWIKRILTEIYSNEFNLALYEGYAGIVQQYMFYYMRDVGVKTK